MEKPTIIWYDPFLIDDDEDEMEEQIQMKEKELYELLEIYDERKKHNNTPVFFKEIEQPKVVPIEVPKDIKTKVYELSNHRKLFIKTA